MVKVQVHCQNHVEEICFGYKFVSDLHTRECRMGREKKERWCGLRRWRTMRKHEGEVNRATANVTSISQLIAMLLYLITMLIQVIAMLLSLRTY